NGTMQIVAKIHTGEYVPGLHVEHMQTEVGNTWKTLVPSWLEHFGYDIQAWSESGERVIAVGIGGCRRLTDIVGSVQIEIQVDVPSWQSRLAHIEHAVRVQVVPFLAGNAG